MRKRVCIGFIRTCIRYLSRWRDGDVANDRIGIRIVCRSHQWRNRLNGGPSRDIFGPRVNRSEGWANTENLCVGFQLQRTFDPVISLR
ncbi:hypothetical protein D3C73_1527410 [compost metagenome]